MKEKGKKIRKNIMVNPDLVKHARSIFNASSDSQAIELCLKSLADRKTEEEVRKATEKFIKSMYGKSFKPLFS